jgi:hypothetical protein
MVHTRTGASSNQDDSRVGVRRKTPPSNRPFPSRKKPTPPSKRKATPSNKAASSKSKATPSSGKTPTSTPSMKAAASNEDNNPSQLEGWGRLPSELLLKVLRDGLGWQRASSCAVRLVSWHWRHTHDSSCPTVQARGRVTDEHLQLLCGNFPSLATLSLDGYSAEVTDEGMKAVSQLAALTSLNLPCYHAKGKVTSEGLRAISSLPALTRLNLSGRAVTNKGLMAVSNIRTLTTLNLRGCSKVTDKGLRPVAANLTALKVLNLCGVNQCRQYEHVSNKKGAGSKVSQAGLKMLRTALPDLEIDDGHEGSEDSYDEPDVKCLGFTSGSSDEEDLPCRLEERLVFFYPDIFS